MFEVRGQIDVQGTARPLAALLLSLAKKFPHVENSATVWVVSSATRHVAWFDGFVKV